MADVFDPAKRSEVMSKIRAKNTKAELIAFSYLRKQGIYFQKHYKRALGTPDIALPRKKKAVFIDSDFWHGRTYKALLIRRGDANDYWVKKIEKNMDRDKLQRNTLSSQGWKVLVIWEEDIKRKRTREEVLEQIMKFLINEK
jgi:DNA mismatch endonuclease (patch repair protein)